MTNPNHDELRRYPRIAIRPGYAPVQVRSPMETEPLDGHVYDVSRGGLKFELDHALEDGQTVDLAFELPGDQPVSVHARGKIVRTHEPDEVGPTRMGLSFTELASRADHDALERFLGRGHSAVA